MKRLFVFVPALIVVFLLHSFVRKEKAAGEKITEGTKSFCDRPSTDSAKVAVANVNRNKPGIANIIFTSDDGGKTWQDISAGLPVAAQPVQFFSGDSNLYLHVQHAMYSSKGNLKTPVWEKENVPDLQPDSFWPATAIAFNRSGVMAFNYNGKMYQKTPGASVWQPVHTDFKKHAVRTIFETAGGAVFVGNDDGLYKSADKGKNWKQVQEGMVTNIVEAGGVLVATGRNGIMRSTDNGEHWQWVISEGGIGIAVEHISGGFVAISYNTKTESRRMRISLDLGKTWQAIDEALPPSQFITSIKQMGRYLVCGHHDGIFLSADMGKTWNKVHPGIGKQVFTIYASGNVLYAVSGSAGC